jgi:hypothetical protein
VAVNVKKGGNHGVGELGCLGSRCCLCTGLGIGGLLRPKGFPTMPTTTLVGFRIGSCAFFARGGLRP